MPSIQFDSRKVEPNDIFVALPCPNVRQHCLEARKKGASVVFACPHPELQNIQGLVFVNNVWSLASKLARFQYPKQPRCTIAITGTNGKSSVAHFVSQFWTKLGIPNACLGTVGLFVNGAKQPFAGLPNLTTPDALNLHKVLSYAQESKLEHFVFEASSAALDQHRLHSVDLSAAAFLNIASDHLDYHKSHEVYFQSKLRLFSEILHQYNPAVVLGDDTQLCHAVHKIHPLVLTFGLKEFNDIFASNIQYSSDKIVFDLHINSQIFPNCVLNMIGQFQLLNCLAAIALLTACNLASSAELAADIPSLTTLTGRLEYITSYNFAKIYIDFAHTSEAFRNCLQELNKLKQDGRLICVFGCGGDRDQSKRQEFGQLANKMADIIIVTDDNPRHENPDIIRSQILKSCPKAMDISDRKRAIQTAISLLKPHDILAIIGKGHEEYQIYGDKQQQFSDRATVLELCNNDA